MRRRRPSARVVELVAQARAVREASAFEGYDVVIRPRAQSAEITPPTWHEGEAPMQPQAVRRC